MPKITRSALIGYSAMQMYQLVNDVLSYPQFLPGCVASRLIENSDTELIATIDVAKMGVQKSFTTHNYMIPGKQIILTLVEGPFRSLDGRWLFTDLAPDSCKVDFDFSFNFKNALLDFALNPMFSELANSMVQVFQQRAKQIYGK